MSVMNGFREQLVESLSGVNGDITIYDANKDKIKKYKKKILQYLLLKIFKVE